MTHREFKTRFLPCHEKIYRIAFRYLGNEYDAEDMVQNAYLKLWEKRDSLESIENNEAYALTIVKHLCLDKLRQPTVQTDSEAALIQESETALQPDEACALKEEMAILLNIIGQLPEQQRRVLVLKHFEGRNTYEIEQETGLSNANVRVLLSRARKSVKELFIQRL